MRPSSGQLGKRPFPVVFPWPHAWFFMHEDTEQLYMAPHPHAVPSVLTTIHWIPRAKDLCRSQTHLQQKLRCQSPWKLGCAPHTPYTNKSPEQVQGHITTSLGAKHLVGDQRQSTPMPLEQGPFLGPAATGGPSPAASVERHLLVLQEKMR